MSGDISQSTDFKFFLFFIFIVIKYYESVCKCTVLELVPLKGEEKFKPRPLDRSLVLLRGSLQISQEYPCPFYMDVPSGSR